MRVVSIDPGVVNLGVVDALFVDNEFTITDAQVVDVRQVKHKTVAICDCQLSHATELSSYVAHFVQEHQLLDADKVIIERQPPKSAGYATQQLLQAFLVKPPILVHPARVRQVYNASATDTYDQRKQKSVAFAQPYLSHHQAFALTERKHDIADAVCMLFTLRDQLPKTKRPAEVTAKPSSMSFERYIKQFAYSSNDGISEAE